MEAAESTLLVLLLILSLGLVVPELFRKLRLPFVTSLILVGAVLGPNSLGVIEINETVTFFGFLGMTFLMLMAGLETKMDHIKESAGKVFIMSAANGLIPAIAGFLVTFSFGYGFLPSAFVGIIFISSSVALIIPSLRSVKLFSTKVGQIIVSSVVVEDLLSLSLLAILLQSVDPITTMPLWLYIGILVLSVLTLKAIIPKLSHLVLKKGFIFKHQEHEDQIRYVIVILMAILLYFSILGVHPIIAAFLVGLLLSSVISSDKIYTQIHTIGYGIFVPVFFFVIGMQIDLKIFYDLKSAGLFFIAILFTSVLVKFLSGYFSARLENMSKYDAKVFGIASTIHLTTALAATHAGYSANIIDETLMTSIVMLSVVTTIFAPILLKFLRK